MALWHVGPLVAAAVAKADVANVTSIRGSMSPPVAVIPATSVGITTVNRAEVVAPYSVALPVYGAIVTTLVAVIRGAVVAVTAVVMPAQAAEPSAAVAIVDAVAVGTIMASKSMVVIQHPSMDPLSKAK